MTTWNVLATITHTSERRALVQYIVDVCCWGGTLAPADPDGDILAVRIWPRNDAIKHLERFPWCYASEPLVTYLRGDSPPGALWHYADRPEGTVDLISYDRSDDALSAGPRGSANDETQ